MKRTNPSDCMSINRLGDKLYKQTDQDTSNYMIDFLTRV